MFNLDGKFYAVMSTLGDLVLLNILYVICCIPIITMGAATTALYGVTKKMAAKKEGYIVRSFFKMFKENFKHSTIVWILTTLVFIILSTDIKVISQTVDGQFMYIYLTVIMMAVVVMYFVWLYTNALLTTFENKLKTTVKNALLMGIAHFPWTILIMLISLFPYIVVVIIGKINLTGIMIILLISFSVKAYINSFIFNRIFNIYINRKEESEIEKENN